MMFPADAFDGVVGEVRARRHQRVDVAVADEVRDDFSHSGRDHRARESEEGGHVVVQHLGVDVHGFVDVRRADPRVAVLVGQFADGHPRTHFGVGDRVVVELLAVNVMFVFRVFPVVVVIRLVLVPVVVAALIVVCHTPQCRLQTIESSVRNCVADCHEGARDARSRARDASISRNRSSAIGAGRRRPVSGETGT